MKIISAALSLLILFGSVPAFSLDLGAIDKEYFIEVGDIVNVTVFPAEEFSKEVTVQPDGNIEIPILGIIKAQGVKAEELQKVLTAKFSKYVSNPVITVNVRKFASSKVAIIGESKGAGYFEYREGMRLLDLVAQAGGVSDYARTDRVRIYRRLKTSEDKVKEEVVKADLKAVFNGRMDKNITLTNGDIVYVPRKPFASATKWVTESFMPWATLFTFVVTASIVARKN